MYYQKQSDLDKTFGVKNFKNLSYVGQIDRTLGSELSCTWSTWIRSLVFQIVS